MEGCEIFLIKEKFKEVLSTVLPISILVFILHLTLVPLEADMLGRFYLGALFIIIGLTIFLIGVDLGITPIGDSFGNASVKSNSLYIIGLLGLVLGFVISIAEPDLHILANQVGQVTNGIVSKTSLVVLVSVGVAILISLGLMRIVKSMSLKLFLLIVYGIILVLAFLGDSFFLAVSFDASGATTGALTVPFLLALASGASSMNKDSRKSEEDSFGLVGIASAGAIIGALVLGMVSKVSFGDMPPVEAVNKVGIFSHFIHEAPIVAKEIIFALLPIILIYIVANFKWFHNSKRANARIFTGLTFTFVGLVIFLVGVNSGFMDVGRHIGHELALRGNNVLIVGIAFLMGVLTILAEPAVHVLTNQIESVTSGSIKKKVVLMTLSVGVGIAVALSVLKILVPSMQLWHVLLPGYILTFVLMRKVPNLFVGIAFDSGGVASGPMTATFILAYAQGIANTVPTADLLLDGFGTIAMVAMTPLIALQILGLFFIKKNKTEV